MKFCNAHPPLLSILTAELFVVFTVNPLFMLLQSGRQRKKAVMMPRVVLTPLKVNGEHVPSGKHHKNNSIEHRNTQRSRIHMA